MCPARVDTQQGRACSCDRHRRVCIERVSNIIDEQCTNAADKSRTGKLWIQYYRQVSLIRMFIRAERTGDWELHLHCMLPHFHAAGHIAYVKSAHLYTQQMLELPHKMPAEEYRQFTEKGFFTIRLLERFWNGVFSDQTIEQSLMRLLKTSGGMTRGRGITDSTLTKWVHALPRCVPICNALENFTCVQSGTSEQHKDLRPSSERTDNTDLSLFLQWLEAHSPFVDCQSELMVSISTGIVADSSVNCDDAVQVGQTAIAKMMGKTYAKLTLRRKDKVKSFVAMKNTVRVRGEDVVVNPSLLFNRITCILNTSSELDVFLQYELAPQPPALFVDGQMRKSAKSALGNVVKTMVTCQKAIPDASIFVLDGGHLLHSVVWPKPATYQEVCETYKSYILSRYNSGVTVVFDGYAGPISTKSAEQKRRATRCTSADIVIAPSLPTTTSQNEFLGNGGNKTRLINALTPLLENAGIIVKQAVSDADTLIVETALQRATSSQFPVVVVGTDTDILVMLVARSTACMHIHFVVPWEGTARIV